MWPLILTPIFSCWRPSDNALKKKSTVRTDSESDKCHYSGRNPAFKALQYFPSSSVVQIEAHEESRGSSDHVLPKINCCYISERLVRGPCKKSDADGNSAGRRNRNVINAITWVDNVPTHCGLARYLSRFLSHASAEHFCSTLRNYLRSGTNDLVLITNSRTRYSTIFLRDNSSRPW